MLSEGLVQEVVDANQLGFDELKQILYPHKQNGSFLLLDDSMHLINNDISRLFTEGVHHWQTNICFVSQSLFIQNDNYRTMSLNASYIILMRNIRDKRQIHTLARQYVPHRPSFLVESFTQATSSPFSYLVLDCRNDSCDLTRIRTRVFPDQAPLTVFVENSTYK